MIRQRHVGCRVTFDVTSPSRLAFAIHAAATIGSGNEQFSPAQAGDPLPWSTVDMGLAGSVTLVDAPPGRLEVVYEASVDESPVRECEIPFGADQLVAMRQSRYCPSDRLDGFVASTFDMSLHPSELARQIGSWVFNRVQYVLGSSGPADTAVDTLLTGNGVCRDFAHLTISLCRAVGIAARLVSAYAPGLSPMDFHAVAEIWNGVTWEIIDATRLAPRSSLVRIATGRDAADTAFVTVLSGEAEFTSSVIFAIIDGDLPLDDHESVVSLAGHSR
jgi:transglutaminase-like putative cysteine protease